MTTPVELSRTAFEFFEDMGGATHYVPHVVDPGTNLLVVALMPRTGSGTNQDVKWNGVALTPLSLATLERPQFWSLANPALGAGNIEITELVANQNIVEGCASNLQGVDLVTPNGAFAEFLLFGLVNSGSVDIPSLPLALVFATYYMGGLPNSGVLTPGAGETIVWDKTGTIHPEHRAAGSREIASGVLTTMSFTKADAATEAAISGIAFYGADTIYPGPAIASFSPAVPTLMETIRPSSAVAMTIVPPDVLVVLQKINIEVGIVMTPDADLALEVSV